MHELVELWVQNSIDQLHRKNPQELIYEIRMLQLKRDWIQNEQDVEEQLTLEEKYNGTN